MTQKEFMEINIPIIKANTIISYKICDGVVITFKQNEGKDNYNLYLNGYEIGMNNNYSDNSIRNDFLYIRNNAIYYHSIRDKYVIPYDINLPIDLHCRLKFKWEDVKIEFVDI